MERRPLARQAFAYRLGRAIEAKRAEEERFGRRYGLRTIAVRLDPDSPERMRRNLQRLMAAEYLPRAEMREALARELGVDAEIFDLADDSPEAILNELHNLRRTVDELKWLVAHGTTKEMATA